MEHFPSARTTKTSSPYILIVKAARKHQTWSLDNTVQSNSQIFFEDIFLNNLLELVFLNLDLAELSKTTQPNAESSASETESEIEVGQGDISLDEITENESQESEANVEDSESSNS